MVHIIPNSAICDLIYKDTDAYLCQNHSCFLALLSITKDHLEIGQILAIVYVAECYSYARQPRALGEGDGGRGGGAQLVAQQ